MAEKSATFTAPVFPLSNVLLPHMTLPLHIFEERYRTLIADIRHTGGRFCVALISEGEEVGEPAEPFSTACLAEIIHLQPLAEGRFFLIASGIERVRILSTDTESTPYLQGVVELWPDADVAVPPHMVARAAALFTQYARYLATLTGQQALDEDIPDDPVLLSYVIAAGLQIDPTDRQRLLELPGPVERLQAEVDVLQIELPLMRAVATAPRPPEIGDGRFSAN
jgi:uncharacterized protein